jgi:hypothetical protein
VIEEHPPFDALDADDGGKARVAGISGYLLDEIYEGIGIPAIAEEAEQGFVGGQVIDGCGDLRADGGHNRVVACLGVPVLAVGKITFTAMEDGVPEAAIGRAEILRDGVGLVEPIVPEPEAGEHGVGGLGADDGDAEELIGLNHFKDFAGIGVAIAADGEALIDCWLTEGDELAGEFRQGINRPAQAVGGVIEGVIL